MRPDAAHETTKTRKAGIGVARPKCGRATGVVLLSQQPTEAPPLQRTGDRLPAEQLGYELENAEFLHGLDLFLRCLDVAFNADTGRVGHIESGHDLPFTAC